MNSKTEERSSIPVVALKVFALVLPSIIAGDVFREHSKLAFCIGLFVGAFAWYFVPPRGRAKHLVILLAACVVISAIRYLMA
jgi:hypothetical protein